jgi:ornithine cyclodeaminase/alanine dehydrogenase-like protein (mu-crystallin family)
VFPVDSAIGASAARMVGMTIVLDDDAVTARLRPGPAVAAMRSALLAAYRGELAAPPRVRASVLAFTAAPLGAVLAGDHPGRTDPDAITLYASVGLAGTEPYLLASLLGLQVSV